MNCQDHTAEVCVSPMRRKDQSTIPMTSYTLPPAPPGVEASYAGPVPRVDVYNADEMLAQFGQDPTPTPSLGNFPSEHSCVEALLAPQGALKLH